MKKLILPFVISVVFAFGSTVSASELNSSSPGVTPDQLLYSVDQLLEDFQLYLTTNSKKETEILLELANERLAEAQAMTEEGKHEFIDILMKNYVEKLALAEEQIAKLLIKDRINEETLSDFETSTEEVTLINEDIQKVLTEEVLEEIESQQASIKQLPAVVRNIDEESVSVLRNQGFGFGQIAHMYILSEASGKTIDEISSIYTRDDKGFGELAKELGLHPSDIKDKIAYKNLSTDEEKISSTVEEEEEISVPIDTESNKAEVITTTLSAQPKVSEIQLKTTNASAPKAVVTKTLAEQAALKTEDAKKQTAQVRLTAEQKKAEEAKVKEEQREADTVKKNTEGKNQQTQKVNENKNN
ncbi:DUF5667 domain-containing protein [Robertmurraya korlensis]|uniref:DUF5667 domain-containing protein n=1 Tax=Robertmurraya korlensis TaxID=519977 RepID=UPI00203E8A36|nr:DUF5667 domain-containing protein [Robertmurraya korlensis]MCM3599993.1 DUF5667 domain-containing protein [Robertmurraya korlensis]